MKAAIFGGPRDITVGERPDPVIQEPSDAIVRVTLACVCGSDLWYYRGLSPHDLGAIGHEFIGFVDEVGADVRDLKPGDFVVTPFTVQRRDVRPVPRGLAVELPPRRRLRQSRDGRRPGRGGPRSVR